MAGRLLRGVVDGLRVATITYLLIAAGVVVNMVQLATAAAGGFLSTQRGRDINVWLMSIYMSAAAFLLEEWSSCKVVTHGERVPPNVRALVIINHVSDIDGIAGLAWFARMPPPFPGCVKAIVKESIGRVPIFGWMLRCGEYVFLRRDWRTDASRLSTELYNIASTATPYWVVLFPEGSRRTGPKVAASQAYSRSRGLPVLSHLLFPRFKAFVAAIQAARAPPPPAIAAAAAAAAARQGRNGVSGGGIKPVFEAVVDATFVFEPPTPPTVWECLSGRAASTIHMHVTYHPMASLPGGDGSAAVAAAVAAAADGGHSGGRRGGLNGASTPAAAAEPAPGATCGASVGAGAGGDGASPFTALGSDAALEAWLTHRWVVKDALLAEYEAAPDMDALHPIPPLPRDAPPGAYATFPPSPPRTAGLRAIFSAVTIGGMGALRAAAARPALLRALLGGAAVAAAVLVASFALILKKAPVKKVKAP